MNEDDLKYKSLVKRIGAIQVSTGLSESASFLIWFLENIYRLEETEARDAICDNSSDKGIDGIYVDHNNEEIHFLQGKIRQKDSGTVGDVGPKNLAASVEQFSSKKNVEAILDGNADQELKKIIHRTGLIDAVEGGYKRMGIYVTNESQDKDSTSYLAIVDNIRIYDREEIADRFVEYDAPEGKKGEFTFDVSYVEPLSMTAGTSQDKPTLYMFPARALQLVHMEGISDGTLFRENVRYTLGNTAVNRSIRRSIADKKSHSNFVLFHNGIIVLCSDVDDSTEGELTVKNYSVVNGAQSLTSFYREKAKISEDLRVLVRVIVLQDDALSRTITENSNNQNAIKARDLRSNHGTMLRLQKEFQQKEPGFFFEIKRGEKGPVGKVVIPNDAAGRALLAFDVQEPWSAHQIYKVFDEKYAEIFGRPEVDANRIVFVQKLMDGIGEAMTGVKNRPMASYTLTRYFLLYVLSQILRADDVAKPFAVNPGLLNSAGLAAFIDKCGNILKTLVVDLNYEAKTIDFDYKSILKSPKQSAELADKMLASYEKDVARDKADSFKGWSPKAS